MNKNAVFQKFICIDKCKLNYYLYIKCKISIIILYIFEIIWSKSKTLYFLQIIEFYHYNINHTIPINLSFKSIGSLTNLNSFFYKANIHIPFENCIDFASVHFTFISTMTFITYIYLPYMFIYMSYKFLYR